MPKRLIGMIITIVIILSFVNLLPAKASSVTDFSSTGWTNPVNPMIFNISSDFDSAAYLSREKVRHAGIDLFPDDNNSKPVYAIADGFVYHVKLDTDSDTKNQSVVFIRHKTGSGTEFTAVYGHTYANVSEGNTVIKGQLIGYTRNWSIYHLHFGINTSPNIETSGTLNSQNGWGRVLPSVDPTSLGWRNPISFLSQNSLTQSGGTSPTLNSPSDNITINSGTSITFSWSSTGAPRFKIRFINSSGAGTTDINVNATSVNFTPNNSGNWTWKVCDFPDSGVEGTYSAERHFTVPGSTPPPSGTFRAEYFNNDNDFSSVIWTEEGLSNIDKNWGDGGPGNGVNNDYFGVRFTSQINFTGGWYIFHYEVDDKIKIFIDNNCIVDQWGSHVLNEDSKPVNISDGAHTLKVEYAEINGGARIKVNWFGTTAPTPTLQSISITTPAAKLSYTVGDSLDISGLVVTGTYSDGSTKTENVTAADISDFNSSAAANNQVLTITVGSMTTTYIVQIAALSVTLQSISITTPASKIIYTTGETLDISGLVVTGTYSNKTTATETITFDNITGFNCAVPVVAQVLTITVGGRTTNYKVTIVSPSAVGIQLKDLPLGTVIKDKASWEHKTGDDYTGTGATKPVEWIIVAKNHPGYPANSVTLISKELIGLYAFDDSTNREDSGGSNHWGNSGTPNATTGVRPWLNGAFYNHLSQSFKDAVLITTVPNKVWGTGVDYTTTDKIFLPSGTELGQGNVDWTYPIGTNWGYFTSDTARIASIGGNKWGYWDRSPRSVWSSIVCIVRFSGVFFTGAVAYNSDVGVRPALNLKSDIYVNLNGEVVGSEPISTLESIAITTPATKLIYTVGDTLDISGLVVTGTYSDGSTKTESVTAANITGFNSSAAVINQVLTITVGEKITIYTVTVKAVSTNPVNYQYLTQWTPSSSSSEEMAYDTQGNIYVTNPVERCVYKYTSSGSFISKFGSAGSGDGQFSASICGIVFDTQDNIYVSDSLNNRIQKFTSEGVFITKGSGSLCYPKGLVIDSQGYIYAVSEWNNTIQKFTPDLTLVKTWGSFGNGNGQFDYPDDIAIDSQDNIYIVDDYDGAHYGNCVQKFTTEGEFITRWGSLGSGDGQFNHAQGIAVDSQGNVLITDLNNNRIIKYSANGEFISSWGSAGAGNGQFDGSCDIIVNKQGNVYVSEYGNNGRIQVFTPGDYTPIPTLSSIAITTPAAKRAYITGDMLDITGLVVTGTYSDNTTKVESLTSLNISGFDSTNVAIDQVLTITVNGKTATYIVQIISVPPGNDYTYTITDSKATITKYTGTGGAVTIPDTIDGAMVTIVGSCAFECCNALTNITIPSGLISIGDMAFKGCVGLTNILIPQGVTSIGNLAFYDCNGLVSISIPQGVTSIGDYAFSWCTSLTSITVAVTNLNYASIDGVLYNKAGTNLVACPGGLTSMSIPQEVKDISRSVFAGCLGLTSIEVDINNLIYTSIDGVLFNKEKTILIKCPVGLTSIIIPQGVKSIDERAFLNCSKIKNIIIPQSLTSIGNYAFCDSGLNSITFNFATTTIYDNADTIPTATKIIGFDPSTAKDYAAKYNRTFEVIGTANDNCFIATAAFGSKFTWPVALLRNFRDQYLLTNSWGTAFVNFYYRHSPPIAAIIAISQPLKMLVRVLLMPLIALVYLMYHPLLMVTVLFIMFLIYRYRLRRRYAQD